MSTPALYYWALAVQSLAKMAESRNPATRAYYFAKAHRAFAAKEKADAP